MLWKLIKSQQDINPSTDLQIITVHKFTKSFSVSYSIIFNTKEVYLYKIWHTIYTYTSRYIVLAVCLKKRLIVCKHKRVINLLIDFLLHP